MKLSKNQTLQNGFLYLSYRDGTVFSQIMKFGLSKSIFYVEKHRNLSNFFFIEHYQFRPTFFANFNF